MAPIGVYLRGRVRSLLAFALTIGVSLGVGAIFETITDEGTIHKALMFQKTTLEAVSAFAPLELGERYLAALGTEQVSDPTMSLDALTRSVLRNQNLPDTTTDQPRLAHWAQHVPAPLMPFVALVDVLWNLFGSWSPAQVFIIAAQLALGLLLAILLIDADSGWYSRTIFIPLATVGLGTLVALAGKWLMILGLGLFGRVVSLAGLCCSAGGFVFAGYWLAIKHVEERVESFGHHLVERAALGERHTVEKPETHPGKE